MYFYIMLLVAVVSTNGESETLIPGVLVNSNTSTASLPACTTTAIGPQCSSDCATLSICTGSETPQFSRTCSLDSTSKPYCVTNACVSKPDINNINCGGKFICTGKGFYPDPNNCNYYHQCASVGAVASTYQCPTGHIFDVTTATGDGGGCKIGNIKTCPKTNCPSKSTAFAAYERNESFYYFCFENEYGWQQKVMFQCPVNDTFDPSTNSCALKCTISGHLVDPQNCNKYYNCARKGSTAVHISCPEGYWFDKTKCAKETVPCDTESGITSTTTVSVEVTTSKTENTTLK